ncbi:MAG: hypothetical protein QMD94_02760 [Candidatus Omnitrophota bacterium]|nr:hypothetical protein [Candidatus Omnitrophota bacterium]
MYKMLCHVIAQRSEVNQGVIPAPVFTGVNSSGNPKMVDRMDTRFHGHDKNGRRELPEAELLLCHFFLFLYLLLIFPGFALGLRSNSFPFPQDSEIIYEDKPFKLNKIKAQTTCFSSQLSTKEVLNFYKETLVKDGWECKEFHYQAGIGAFSKKDRFFNVLAIDNLKKTGSQVYLIDSSGDLAVCKALKTHLFQQELSSDVAGKDFEDIPRYPGSKRRMSVFAGGGEEGTFLMYEVSAPVCEIAKFYRQMLNDQGWVEELDSQDDINKMPGLSQEIKGNFALLNFHNNTGEELSIQIMAPTGEIQEQISKLNTAGHFKQVSGRALIIISRNIQEILAIPIPELEAE